jgi:hypothetical protein
MRFSGKCDVMRAKTHHALNSPGQKGHGRRDRKKCCPRTCPMLACRHEQRAVESESETGKHRAYKSELSVKLGHSGMQLRLTRYGWNFSVIYYGIIPSNPVASLAIAR